MLVRLAPHKRRASGSGKEYILPATYSVAECWYDQNVRKEGVWFHRKSGNKRVPRPVSHWCPITPPDGDDI